MIYRSRVQPSLLGEERHERAAEIEPIYVAETPKASIRNHEPQLPITPFGIVAYGFVGQPFSKQLYIASERFYNF